MLYFLCHMKTIFDMHYQLWSCIPQAASTESTWFSGLKQTQAGKKKKKKNKTKLLVCYAINASLLLCFFPLHPPRFSGFCVCLKNRLVIFYLQREFPLPHASSWAQKGHNYCPIFLNYNIVSHVCFTLFLILSNRLKNIYIFFKSITGCSAELTIL